MINKVKKMEKGEATFMIPTASGSGYIEETVIKNYWMCKTCGFVWTTRRNAQNCKHVGSFIVRYGGYYENNRQIGGTHYTIKAVRKEKIEGE